MNKIAINEITDIINPKTVATLSGAVVNEIIPSIEYLNKLQKDQLDSPSVLSTFSYSIQCVSNPTHSNIPFENLLYSVNSKTESTTGLVINLKSLAPSTRLTSVPQLIIL